MTDANDVDEIPEYLQVVKLFKSSSNECEISRKLKDEHVYYNTDSYKNEFNIDEKELTIQELEEKLQEPIENESYIGLLALNARYDTYRYMKVETQITNKSVFIGRENDLIFNFKVIGGTYAYIPTGFFKCCGDTCCNGELINISFEKGEIDKVTGKNTFVLPDINIRNPYIMTNSLFSMFVIMSDGDVLTYNTVCLTNKHRITIAKYPSITRFKSKGVFILNNAGRNCIFSDKCIIDEEDYDIMVKPACT